MIQYIENTNPHIVQLSEDQDNIKSFIEDMTELFVRYEVGKFQTPDGKLYKAELMTKTETTRTMRTTHQHAGKIFTWTVQQSRDVTLEYHFKEI